MADAVIGSAEFEIRASQRQLPADLKKAEDEVSRSLKRMEEAGNRAGGALDEGLGGGAEKAAEKAARLGAAVGGVISALIAAGAAAVKFGLDGMAAAAGIDEMSERLGYSTATIQEFRYAARELGQDAAIADRALESFADKFTSAVTGASTESLRAFSQGLGLDQAALRDLGNVETALDVVVQRLSDIENQADRTAVANRVGLSDFVAGLHEGVDGLQELQAEAHAAGEVMSDSMIERAAEAQREFEGLTTRIGSDLRQAFIDLGPAIVYVIGLVATLAQGLADAAAQFRALEQRNDRQLLQESDRLNREQQRMLRQYGSRSNMEGQYRLRGSAMTEGDWTLNAGENFDRMTARRQQIADLLRERETPTTAPPTQRPTIDLSAPTRGPRGTTARDTSAADARRALQAQRRYEDLIRRGEEELAEALTGRAETAQQRADLELAALQRDQAQERVRIDRMLEDGQLSDVEHQTLVAAQERLRFAREGAINDELQAEIAENQLEVEAALADLSAELLSVQANNATTREERHALELELLEIAQEQRRVDLEALLASREASEAQRALAQARLASIEDQERAALGRRNASPAEAYLERLRADGQEMSDQFELVAIDGLDALNEGIVDAIMGAEDLGEVFRRVAQQIIADLARIAIRRAIIEPLANAMFGGSGSGPNIFGGGSTPIPKMGLPSVGAPLAAMGAAMAPQKSALEITVIPKRGTTFDADVQVAATPAILAGASAAYDGAVKAAPARMARARRNALGFN